LVGEPFTNPYGKQRYGTLNSRKIRAAKIRNPDQKYLVTSLVNVRSEGVIEVSRVSTVSFDRDGKGGDLSSQRKTHRFAKLC